MAPSPGKNCTLKILAALVFCFLFLWSLPAPDGLAGLKTAQASSKHLLSWESAQNRERAKRWHDLRRSERRVKVSKNGVIRLKRSTFWNKKPFQFAIPVADEHRVYVGVDAGLFYGIDLKRFKKAWKYETSGPVQAQAALSEDLVYFGDIDGFAYALNAATGAEVWKVSLDSPILAAPLIIAERVYFVTDSSRLFAFNKYTGDEIWHTEAYPKEIGFSVRRGSSPVAYNNLILFGNAQGMLLAYGPDGNISWVRQLGDRGALVSDLDSRPLIRGGCLFVATADQHVFCLDPEANGQIKWSADSVGGVNDLLAVEDRLYASGSGVLSALLAENGNMIWEQDFEIPGISSPAISQNIIAVAATKGKFYLVDPATGDVIFDRYVRGGGSFSDPVFIGETLILLSNSGRLYSFKITEKPPRKKKRTNVSS